MPVWTINTLGDILVDQNMGKMGQNIPPIAFLPATFVILEELYFYMGIHLYPNINMKNLRTITVKANPNAVAIINTAIFSFQLSLFIVHHRHLELILAEYIPPHDYLYLIHGPAMILSHVVYFLAYPQEEVARGIPRRVAKRLTLLLDVRPLD